MSSPANEEPDVLDPASGDVVNYVRELQRISTELSHAGAQPDLPGPELALVRRKLDSIDLAVQRQMEKAGRRLGSDRHEALATLDGIFKLGTLPSPPLDGEVCGGLITSTVFSPIDSMGRLIWRVWRPWYGKRFDVQRECGANILTPGGRTIALLIWPHHRRYIPVSGGLVAAFPFSTYIGPGVHNPELRTLKLDYNRPPNPRFIVRSVLDEVVQLTDNCYLLKWYIRGGGRYHLVGYFSLRSCSTRRSAAHQRTAEYIAGMV